MKLTKTNIRKEATNIINDLFHLIIKSENKKDWKRCLSFIDGKVDDMQFIRGEYMFIWENVKYQMYNRYGKKFILKK